MMLPKMNGRFFRRALLTICVFTLLPFALRAQNATGSLLGEVQDASGARIKSANVVVTDNASSVARQATTDSRGQFRFPDLLPGTYRVAVNAKGFAEASSDVTVRWEENTRELKPRQYLVCCLL